MIRPERLVAKPVEVAAVRFDGFGPDGNGYAVLAWLEEQGVPAVREGEAIRVQTTESRESTAYPGWTFILGTEGEVYPISPAVRAAKYGRTE